jgi:hypothetical protein
MFIVRDNFALPLIHVFSYVATEYIKWKVVREFRDNLLLGRGGASAARR